MSLPPAWIHDCARTPIGRYGGARASGRADDLAALPINALVKRDTDASYAVDQVILGGANQTGEDSRILAWMAVLISDVPDTVPAIPVNWLYASGLDAAAPRVMGIGPGATSL